MGIKNFTTREFNTASNELAKIAGKFTNDGLNSSMSFFKDYTTLTIFDKDCKVICMFTIHRERFVFNNDCKGLIDIAEKANVTLKGKYMEMILEKYKKEERSEGYIIF